MTGRLAVALVAALVAALSELPRVMQAAGTLPASLQFIGFSDHLLLFETRGLAGHQLPYVGAAFEYPPIGGYIAALVDLMATDRFGYVLGWAAVVVIAAGVVGYQLAGIAGGRPALMYWALSPQLLLFAGINYDTVPVAITVAAVAAARADRHARALVLFALGGLTKLFPFAAVPVQLLRGPRPVRAALIVLFLVAIVSVPMILAPRGTELLLFYPTGLEANVDSVWGLLRSVLLSVGLPADPVITAVTLGGLLVTYVVLLQGAVRTRDPAVGIAIAVVVFLLWTRRYSPQYALWLLPFFVSGVTELTHPSPSASRY